MRLNKEEIDKYYGIELAKYVCVDNEGRVLWTKVLYVKSFCSNAIFAYEFFLYNDGYERIKGKGIRTTKKIKNNQITWMDKKYDVSMFV